MMAWAVHLSLADFGDLTARERSGDVNAYERSTNKFLAVSGRFKDPRATVSVAGASKLPASLSGRAYCILRVNAAQRTGYGASSRVLR